MEATNSSNDIKLKQQDFLKALLDGNHKKCIQIANSLLKSLDDISVLYINIIQSSLYEVGTLWEQGKISVAEEHLATAVVSIVMASVYNKFYLPKKQKGTVVITSSPKELHSIGARMVADLLEFDGWEVYYLGSNVPEEDLIKFISILSPDILAISTTMTYNIDNTKDLISHIRNDDKFSKMKIIVGGFAFTSKPETLKTIGADGYSKDCKDVVSLARSWWV